MREKINAEYLFTSERNPEVRLTLYLNHKDKTYDIVQDGQEGILPRLNNFDTDSNREYFYLALEALKFVDKKFEEKLPF